MANYPDTPRRMPIEVDAFIEEIGFYEDVEEQECPRGTPLGYAFEQGWNAALIEARARLKRAVAGMWPCAGPYPVCPHCGSKHNDWMRQCPTTGAAIPVATADESGAMPVGICPNCGGKFLPSSWGPRRYTCSGCGAVLVDEDGGAFEVEEPPATVGELEAPAGVDLRCTEPQKEDE